LTEQGLPNAHRFLFRLEINKEVEVALRLWAKKFYSLVGELPTK
jgi:hypothetical protein